MLHPVLFHVTLACVGSVFKLCFYVSWCSMFRYGVPHSITMVHTYVLAQDAKKVRISVGTLV